jgi:hypothetical protein
MGEIKMNHLRLLIVLCLATFSNQLLASKFGYSGSSGSDGYNGVNGIDAQSVSISANQAQTFILNGTNGSGGGDGSRGSSASSCYQSQGHSDEYGADGGNGGDGGYGGRGGDGGSVTVFYKNLNELKNITIQNQGGLGAVGGHGAEGGYACTCSTYSWSHRTCRDVQRCTESQSCSTERICEETGETRTEDGTTAPVRRCFDRRRCSPVRSCRTVNECTSTSYSCSSGDNGSHGSRGSHGRNGYWGTIKLVKDITSIPSHSPEQSYSLAELVAGSVNLSKQIWETNTDGKSLFAASSVISGSYIEFIELAQRQFKVVWLASRSIESIGAVSLDLSFDGETISHSINGDVLFESALVEQEGVTVLTITNAYKADELKELEIVSTKGYGKNLSIILKDKAGLSSIVKTDINLQFVYKRKLGRWFVTYDALVPSDKISFFDDRIEIRVGELGINYKHIKRKRKVRYTLRMKRSFGDSSTNVKLYQSKIKLR